jgi:hypothetical protein
MPVIYVPETEYITEDAVMTSDEVLTNGAVSDKNLLLAAEADALASMNSVNALVSGGFVMTLMVSGA